MKKIAFLFLCGIFCSTFSVFSQSEINQFDAQGKRHGIWKKTFEGTDQLRYEGTFDHGAEVGEFKFYCEDCKNQPMVVKNFIGNDKIAEVKYFTIKGKLVSEGKMKDKDRIGEWLYYHEKSKNIMTRENYSNGKLDGKKITYYPNGKITEETTYKNGIREGVDNYYSPEGVLLKKLIYKEDQLQGPAFYYDAYGNVVIEGFYKDGKKHGLWKYFKNGNVVLEETYPKKSAE
ncbi:toxin-antitoxin system YwqK family antitoxin [Aequorivita sp. SDUM287046]|uniref:Toxin-antitoxin system YwqK family antitoxin n=1 Tax=Aequorivita aurantiaca TaxID=3053356 RepID=A0ABT8DHU9_9FLAO|nr:toxin-antitoxin system YwqK family antitoxin [Aequorivita aurantiaca]MDN3724982.1 toxin-antitoxin system YwqK family antitoxin [Aequorivita aurantiaca]